MPGSGYILRNLDFVSGAVFAVPSMEKYAAYATFVSLHFVVRNPIVDIYMLNSVRSSLCCNIIVGIIPTNYADSRRPESPDEALADGTDWKFIS
jgi:hypothetical protein